MRGRTTAAILAVLALALGWAAGAGAAVGVYRNTMETDAQRGQMVKLFGERCASGGSSTAFRVFVGKATAECGYRTPVVGRDLEIAAVGRLLAQTPKPLQRKAFIALDLRADEGSRYELAVYPLQAKAQLRRISPAGKVEYLHIEKNVTTVKGLEAANQLRLQAFNVTSGPEKGSCHLFAYVGSKLVAEVVDPGAGELEGRAAGFSAGASGSAKGTTASFDDVVVRVPSPFGP
jgi:hypothetical protein